MVTVPIKNDTLLNIAAMRTDFSRPPQPVDPRAADWGSWVETVSQEEMLSEFSDWGEDAQKVLRCMEKPSRWAIHVVYPPLKTFVKDKIVLIGDAVRVHFFFFLCSNV
jgi:salicylate hydroxylase